MRIESYVKLFESKKSSLIDGEGNGRNYNYFYEVTVINPEDDSETRFEGFEDGYVIVSKRFTFEYRTYYRINIENLNNNSFNGFLKYKGSRLVFDRLSDISWVKRNKFKAGVVFGRFFEKIKLRIYRSRDVRVKQQFDVLNALMELYLLPDIKSVCSYDVLRKLHTDLWVHHPERQTLQKEVDLCLDAFLITGDLAVVSENAYKPTGKAFLTIKKNIEDEEKYKESIKMQRRMFWASFFSFCAAAVSAYAALSNK